ncbi:sialic acid synthase [Teleopsis dalmanni]|uniref:sialic acid synthase n=1 Tax=Teleopsis dalmanni TaxID=139649 RepID=UPI0018CF8557|nr:sialic acid synthase [Teleopsis dalmanni]XP_037943162.1 sialic acid synthase [Teleopsis dalmanni]
MSFIQLGDVKVERGGKHIYIIAEIGQNHQGNIEIAKQLILQAKKAGCHCVKLQKSCLRAKFTKSALDRCYDNPNSWGSSYGEHKEYLEFTLQQFDDLQKFCFDIGIDFTSSAMDEVSLKQLDELDVPFIKIGSGDANNFLMLEKAAALNRPLIISTGMQSVKSIDAIVKIMRDANKTNYALLHCVSSYPTEPKDCNLQMITVMSKKYPEIVIGYSGHEIGINISKAAVVLGAKIIERHITLDKNQKGSDHKCSLEPDELQQMIQDINSISLIKPIPWTQDEIINYFNNNINITQALHGSEKRCLLACEWNCKSKLGKSIVAARDLERGRIITKDDICIKVSEPNGIPAECLQQIMGHSILIDIKEDNPLMSHLFSHHIEEF